MTGLPKSIIRRYGISKEAWRVYRALGKKTPLYIGRKMKLKKRGKRLLWEPSPKRVRRKKTMARRRRRSYRPRIRRTIRRRGGVRGIMSGIFPGGIFHTVAGAGALVVAQRYQPFGGSYKPAIDKIALGVVLPMVGMGNKDFLSVGIKEGIATLVNQYLGGGAISPTGQGL